MRCSSTLKQRARRSSPGLAAAGLLAVSVLVASTCPAAPTAQPLNCNGTYTGMAVTNLTVAAGQSCSFASGSVSGNVQQSGGSLTLLQSTVTGNVQIGGGGSFAIGPGATINGNLEIQNLPVGAATNSVCGSIVRGNLQFHNNGSAVILGSTNPGSCAGNTVGGNLEVHDNTAATTIAANAVTGNLDDHNNAAPTQVYFDVVGGNLTCQQNASITGGGNRAKATQAQCAAFPATAARAVTKDITGQFAITRPAPVLNPATNTYDTTLTVTNTSGAPVLGPILATVSGLPSTVTLANMAGQTSDGKPYVSPLPAGTLLQPGATLSFVLKFANPQAVAIGSAVQILYTVVVPPNAPSLIGAVATGGTNAYLVGRVDGAVNQSITLQPWTSATCVLGTLVGGIAGTSVTTMTDGAGYFGASVAGVAPGAFVAVQLTAPTAGPMSSCLVSARDNDSWPKAFALDGSPVSAQDFIDAPGKARWYKFSVTPGQSIQLTLSGLPADYDLAVFKDIAQVFANQFQPGSAQTVDLLKLTAEYAPSIFSPSIFSPSIFSPDAYSPSIFSPSIFSPSIFSPSIFSPSIFSPSIFSPSIFSPSIFSPSIFSPSIFSPSIFSPSIFSSTQIAQAFSTAQTRSVIAVSATSGTGDKALVVNTWNSTGNFYVRVVGRNGAFSTSRQFTLTVTKGPTSCTAVTDTTLTPRAAVAATGLKTVILTDSSRIALDATLPGPGATTLRAKLAAFAQRSEIKGVVIDLAGDARVGTLKAQAAANLACPFAQNLVAQEIKGIVDAYRANNPLQYVVLVGNDSVIPFFRFPDESNLGPEVDYVPPVQSNSASQASLSLNYVLSQDAYGSKTALSLPSNDFPVPGLAVGRLVENPSDIAGVIDAYVAANGVVVPGSSLVTGYDFLAQAANAVTTELAAGIGAAGAPVDTLITPDGVSPQDTRPFPVGPWTATNLAAKLFGARHDVIFLAGHFSANSALAADFATSLITTDLAASTTDFTNAIVFSAGCHSGYNLVDSDAIPGVTLPLDWAQAFARKKATLIAGTGYQYGDTDFIQFSEQIYLNFARELRAGTGAIAVGAALVAAKLDYLATTPDIRGIPEKSLLEATLYGLPMLGVNMPSGRGAGGGTAATISPTAVAAGPASTLGLKTYDLNVAPALTPHTISLTNLSGGANVTASYLSGPDGVVSKPGEPVLPLAALNVTPVDASLVLRGIGFRGGTYIDSAPLYPFSGAATTELRGVHVPFVSPIFYPARMWSPNYFGALAGSGGTELLVTPVQHIVADLLAGTSTQRKYTGLNLRLYYSGNLSQAALSDAPSIVGVDAEANAGGVLFFVQVTGNPAAAIYQVWITYSSDGANAWQALDLAQCVAPLPAACSGSTDSRLWVGQLASTPAKLKYVVQAVSGVGLVALDDNRGAYYGFGGATPAATTPALVSPPTSATVGDSVSITTNLTFAGVPVAGKTLVVAIGGASAVGTTGANGNVTVQLPVAIPPGTYPMTVSFGGDDTYQASSTTTSFVVAKAAASLAPLASSVAPAGVSLAGIVGGTTTALQQVSVAFTLSGPGGATTVYAITDDLGNATLPPPSGLPAGSYTVTKAAFAGNTTFNPASVALNQQFVVPKLNQSITFGALANKTYGDPDFAVFASASSGLAVSFGASGNCTLAGSTVHLTGGGTCTITADQAGDGNYLPAPTATRSFSIVSTALGPTVVSLARAVPNPTMADSVTYTLTLSDAVTGVAAGNFAMTVGGALTGASVGAISGGGATWTVVVNTGRGTGSLHLDLVNGTGITNGAGAALVGWPFTGQTYQIDKGGTVLGSGQGQPVAGFGSGGYALFSDVQPVSAPNAIAVLAGGRILVAGSVGCAQLNPIDPASPGYCGLQLARYSASGAADATFGTNGRITTAVTTINGELSGMFVNSDGTFLVAGSRYNGTAEVFYVAKFTSGGTPDATFGTNGIVSLDALPLGHPTITGSAIDGSGRIVLVGLTQDVGPERQDVLVTRLTSAGAADTTFGTGGVAQFAISTTGDRFDRGTTVAVQPADGKIVVGGRTRGPSLNFDFFVMRLDPSGARDGSFGTNGVVTTRFPASTGDNFGRKLVLQPDGKIVLAGSLVVGAALQCGIARFNSDGTLDSSFGTGGQVQEPVTDGCFNISLQPDGKLVIVGNDHIGDVSYGTFIRLLQTGALDTGFGNGGLLDISNFDTPGRVAFTSGGNLATSLTIEDPADGVQKSYVVELTTTLTGPWVAQSIMFGALPGGTYGEVFQASATATSGLPVSFAASGACSVAGNFVQLTGVGNCTVTATQAGDATWFAATPVAQTFAVTPATQAITFGPAPAGVTVGQPLVTISATSASSTAPSTIPIVFSSTTPGVCITGGINGASLALVSAGQCTIVANQAGDGNYNAAANTLSFTVGAAGAPPSTFVVANLNDSGPGSLRDAIAQANAHAGPDVVDLSGLSGTILLTSGQIQISGPTRIVGPGAGSLTIDGNANNRIFAISNTFPACPALDGPEDYFVSISGLRLTNGRRNVSDSTGGAISTEHSLALDSMVIDNNKARGGGGVVFQAQYPGQTLTISNSHFLNNVATELVPPTAAPNDPGGALYVVEKCLGPVNTLNDLPTVTPVSVTIANSEFRGNSSQPVILPGLGGAIRLWSRADVVISDTTIVDNHVDAPNPPIAGQSYHGGAIEGTAKSLRIERSEIAENTANDITLTDATRSGGLHLDNSLVTRQGAGDTMAVKIVNSTISGNASSATAGALVAFGNLALEIDNSTVSNNVAAPTRTGGIIMSSGDTYPVSGNTTSRPTLKLVSSILANNSSSAGDLATNTATIPSFAVSASNSLIEKYCSSCNLSVSGSGNLVPVGANPGPDPVLGPLAYNGGTTRTHALLPGSPAVNAGTNPLALATDQRGAGFLRVVGAAADMGAYESGQAVPLTNYAYLSQFGSSGAGNGQFNVPYGLAIDPTSHKIAVTDYGGGRVQIFNSAGAYLSQFGSAGGGNGQFAFPAGIAIDPASHNIVVADSGNNRVQIFNSAGVYLSQFGTLGTGNGQLSQPYGVAIDPVSHNIVVTDGNNRRVQIFNSAGVYLSQFGTPGAGNGQFNVPFGVAIDPASRDIVVSDFGGNRVQVFDSAGTYLSQFGTAGGGAGQFSGAGGVAIDPTSHNIVVTDYFNNRVQIFNSAGMYLSQVGASGSGNGQFNGTYGVAIDPTSHNIGVSDTGGNRVEIFAPQ